MGRAPCCDKANVKKGPWSPEEDAKLKDYMDNYGTAGNWIALPHKAGLKRCGKSCRLRWLNYLRPNIKHGEFSDDEDRIICTLYANIGSRWSIIAAQLPGRTDNDIKNYWNTKLKKKILGGCHVITPPPHRSSKQHNFTASFYSPPPPPLAPAVSPYSYFTEASTLSFMSCSSSEEETLIQTQTQMGNSNMQSFGSIYGVGAVESHVQNNQTWSTGGEEMITSNNNYPLLENNYYSQIEEIKNLISSCSSNNYVSSSSNNSRSGMSSFLFAENKGSSSNLSDDGRSSSACTATAAINADCSLYNHKI